MVVRNIQGFTIPNHSVTKEDQVIGIFLVQRHALALSGKFMINSIKINIMKRPTGQLMMYNLGVGSTVLELILYPIQIIFHYYQNLESGFL